MKKILPKIYLLFMMLLIIVALMGCSDKDRSVVNDEKRILTIGVASETTLLSPLYMDSMNYYMKIYLTMKMEKLNPA